MKMPFGQYKDWELADIPVNYLLWLSEEADLWPRLKLEVEIVLEKLLEEREQAGARLLSKDDRARLIVLTVDDVAQWWDYYSRWFSNEFYGFQMSRPILRIDKSRRFMGYWSESERVLMLNNYFILPQDRFENILIHEMCHQYVSERGIDDTSPHGKRWRNIAARMSFSTKNKITIVDEQIYAPNNYFQKGELVILPTKESKKNDTELSSIQEIESSYAYFTEEMSNM